MGGGGHVQPGEGGWGAEYMKIYGESGGARVLRGHRTADS